MEKQFYKKILLLEYLTIGWNMLEGFIAITIGVISGSISLVAFGLESGIEVFSSVVTVWELKCEGNGRRDIALKLISVAFLFVAIYITISAINSLLEKEHSEPMIWGIIYMAMVSVVMSILGYLKRDLGKKMKNPVIIAEANFTFLDVALSISILIGLIVHILLNWWWIDQVLALIIALNAFVQGIIGLRRAREDRELLCQN